MGRILGAGLAGIIVGYLLAQDWTTPQVGWGNEHGVFITTTRGAAFQALEMAVEYCKGWPADPVNSTRRKYPVVTSSAVRHDGGLWFDCIPHLELTGPRG